MPRCLALLVFALMFLPTAAMAHTSIVETDPADGASLARLPRHAILTFNERPTAVEVVLTVPGSRVRAVKSTIEGSRVFAVLPATGPRGTYALSYRVVSEDGHPVTGTLRFTVTSGATAPATTAPGPSQATRTGRVELGWLGGIALVVLVAALAAVRMRRR